MKVCAVKKIRVGIIGFGKMGRIRAEAIAQIDCAELVKVYDTQSNTDGGVPFASSLDEILEDTSIDAVFLCLPNHMNKACTVRALQAGKHVFCEKPPAFTAAEVIQIRETELRAQKKLMYGFNHRHHGAVQKMKSLVDSGEYGRVLWMRGRYGKSVDESYFDTWRANKDLAGGGILLDQGIHMLDLFNYIGGAGFDENHAFVSSLYWNLEGVEDNVFAILKNRRTGLVASLHSTMTQWRHLFSLEVFMEAGYMVLNGLKTSSGTYGEEVLSIARNRTTAPAATWDDEEQHVYQIDTSWLTETQHFFNAIAENIPVQIGSSSDALAVMKLVDDIYQNKRHEHENLNTKLKTIRLAK
ncbi:MAG: Gfo/Idh/MocA family oxidoreductase [Hahellaceae bacterium]|nr:Gfo/Idh/MocA family oxidoreductase [Hahellaceae bacterium]